MHPEQQAALRRVARVLMLAAAVWAVATLRPSQAQDNDPALSGFVRPPAASPRTGVVTAQQWEAVLRPADRMGPPPLRAADQALLAAVRNTRWREALELVKSGAANPNTRDDVGGHALVLAARQGQDELLRELLRRGADVNRLGEDGFSALGAAAYEGRISTVRLLLRASADPKRLGASGQAPLHLAAQAGQLGALQELLRSHPDVELLNRQRESAIDVAAAAGQQAVMDLLIERGADLARAGQR